MPRRSRRVPADLGPNRIARMRQAVGSIPYDLTISNPTACGFDYPPDLLEGLAHSRALTYDPSPQGPATARRAVAARYRRESIEVNPDHIILTASTSEAYGFLFRLLADPGDTIMVPTPSYPLFDQLARLESVRTATYELDGEAAWRMDLPQLAAAPPNTRAVVLVHPNNPTGSLVHADDAAAVVGLCRERGWALIVDEVFLPYSLEAQPAEAMSFAATSDCPTFTLGGLSKSVGLPQLKLAWIIAGGPPVELASALEGLEYVADAYLSVSTPVALAAPELLEHGEAVQAAIGTRCRNNLSALRSLAAAFPAVDVPAVGGGWNAVVRVPALIDDETLCVNLLQRAGVAVHPGRFFGFHRPGFLVLSLLPPENVFSSGVEKLLDHVAPPEVSTGGR